VAFKLPGVIGIETAIKSIPQAACSLRKPGGQLVREATDGAAQLLARVGKIDLRHLLQEAQASRL
jgi:hypothetical protein